MNFSYLLQRNADLAWVVLVLYAINTEVKKSVVWSILSGVFWNFHPFLVMNNSQLWFENKLITDNNSLQEISASLLLPIS